MTCVKLATMICKIYPKSQYNIHIYEIHEDIIVETSNKMVLIQSLFCKGIFHFTFIRDSKKTEYILTKCNHLFHAKCLEPWIECKSKCPNCRREITIE